jgi:signal transduction histidine kinase
VALKDLTLAMEESGTIVHREKLPTVSVDREQLIRLFQNLLSNAIKYRQDKAPEVFISATRGAGEWIFSVEDNGPGIAPEHRERIFQIFQRLKLRSEVTGTGIGLAICRRIVNRHGGKIWIEEGARGGAVFKFTLPGNPMDYQV